MSKQWLDVEHSEHCYLRFGELPEGGRSRHRKLNFLEEGVSVWNGGRDPAGGYVVQIQMPDKFGHKLDLLLVFILRNYPLYLAAGEVCGRGSDNEPLLRSPSIWPIPLDVPVYLPDCFGELGQKFSLEWNRWRMAQGVLAVSGRTLEEPPATVREAGIPLWSRYGGGFKILG